MLTIDQGEFTKDRPDKKPQSWRVPVIARSLDGASAGTVLAGHGTLAVPGCGPVIVNAGQSGYYRTLYAPAAFAALSTAFASVRPIDQLGILSDVSALSFAGLQPVSDLLDLAQNLPADSQPQVLASSAQLFRNLYSYSEGNAARQASLTRFAAARLLPVLDRLGWVPRQDESDSEAKLRDSLIVSLGSAGVPQVVAEARRRFAASATDPTAIPPPLRLSISIVVGSQADQPTWDRLRAMAKAEESVQLKNLLYLILAFAKDPTLTQRALDLALTDEPAETTSAGMISVASQQHPDMAFDFAVAHLPAVMAKIDSSAATRYLPQLGSGSYDPAMIEKIRAYARANLPEGARRPADEAIAAIEYRIMVRDNRMAAIDSWLKANRY